MNTPKGVLSANITAGSDRQVELVLQNTGSSPLENIEMKSSTPSNWKVAFDPDKIEHLEPGGSTKVYATIHADKNAIEEDYVNRLVSTTPETSAEASFRVTVKTPLLWGDRKSV